jgi:hypothetical protein
MGDITQPATETDEDSVDGAALTVKTEPASASISATLPAKHAADLLPVAALVACVAGPPAIFASAKLLATPWWAASLLGLAELVAVVTIYFRARPSNA